MNTLELERLTKLARRLPVSDLKMERIDSDFGEIYFAYGDGPNGIHGVWGYQCIAQMIEFKPDTSVDSIRQVLVGEAEKFINTLKVKGNA